jgi:hypothetical protein
MLSEGSTALGETIFKCPSIAPEGKASLDVALAANTRKMHPTLRFLRNTDYLAKHPGEADFRCPAWKS